MTEPTYTLIASKVMVPYTDTSHLVPADKVATVVLPDGSFFVAVCFVPWDINGTGLIRMWRLDVNLVELGTADIPLTVATWTPIAYLLDDSMKVVLHNFYGGSGSMGESFIVDCAGTTPIVVESGVFNGALAYGGLSSHSSIRLGNGMTLVATGGGVEVWDGLVRKSVWYVETYWFDPSGSLWPHPIDPMKVAVVGWRDVTSGAPSGRLGRDFWTEITVSADGMTITANRTPTPPYGVTPTSIGSHWYWQDDRFAAGSPYLGYPFAIAEGGLWVDVGPGASAFEFQMEGLIDYTAPPAPLPEVVIGGVPGGVLPGPTTHGTYTNEVGPMVRLSDGKFASLQEAGLFIEGTYWDVYSQRLIGTDPVTGITEVLALPYDPSFFPGGPYGGGVLGNRWDTPVTLVNGSMGMAADANSGRIIVGTTLYGYSEATWHSFPAGGGSLFCMQVWSIQGPPGERPNLNGGPLGVDVRFFG